MSDLNEKIRTPTDANDIAFRKIFIGGLSYSTDEEKLKKYFRTYGPVQDAVVMKDPVSKRSRGFGFITFSDINSVDIALANEPHTIDSRKVEAKRAVPRSEIVKDASQNANTIKQGTSPPSNPSSMPVTPNYSMNSSPASSVPSSPPLKSLGSNPLGSSANHNSATIPNISSGLSTPTNGYTSSASLTAMSQLPHLDSLYAKDARINMEEYAYNKIFVGGLHYDTRDAEFRSYFEHYGKVISAEVMFNRETHKSRGFGFIVYDKEESAVNVCAEKEHVIDGKVVEVKRAIPRSKIAQYTQSALTSSTTPGTTTTAPNKYKLLVPSPSNSTSISTPNIRSDIRRTYSVGSNQSPQHSSLAISHPSNLNALVNGLSGSLNVDTKSMVLSSNSQNITQQRRPSLTPTGTTTHTLITSNANGSGPSKGLSAGSYAAVLKLGGQSDDSSKVVNSGNQSNRAPQSPMTPIDQQPSQNMKSNSTPPHHSHTNAEANSYSLEHDNTYNIHESAGKNTDNGPGPNMYQNPKFQLGNGIPGTSNASSGSVDLRALLYSQMSNSDPSGALRYRSYSEPIVRGDGSNIIRSNIIQSGGISASNTQSISISLENNAFSPFDYGNSSANNSVHNYSSHSSVNASNHNKSPLLAALSSSPSNTPFSSSSAISRPLSTDYVLSPQQTTSTLPTTLANIPWLSSPPSRSLSMDATMGASTAMGLEGSNHAGVVLDNSNHSFTNKMLNLTPLPPPFSLSTNSARSSDIHDFHESSPLRNNSLERNFNPMDPSFQSFAHFNSNLNAKLSSLSHFDQSNYQRDSTEILIVNNQSHPMPFYSSQPPMQSSYSLSFLNQQSGTNQPPPLSFANSFSNDSKMHQQHPSFETSNIPTPDAWANIISNQEQMQLRNQQLQYQQQHYQQQLYHHHHQQQQQLRQHLEQNFNYNSGDTNAPGYNPLDFANDNHASNQNPTVFQYVSDSYMQAPLPNAIFSSQSNGGAIMQSTPDLTSIIDVSRTNQMPNSSSLFSSGMETNDSANVAYSLEAQFNTEYSDVNAQNLIPSSLMNTPAKPSKAPDDLFQFNDLRLDSPEFDPKAAQSWLAANRNER